MKQLFRILTVTILLLSVGCIDDDLYNRLDNLEERVSKLEELCREMNTNISSLQTIVTALQTNDYVTAVTPIVEDGKTVGYTISFVKSDPITIYHGKDGKDGVDGEDGQDGQDGKDGIDGYTPVIGVRQDSDGIYYWTLDGDWLLDADGKKIKAQGIDGKDGADGKDGEDGKDGQDGEKGEPGEPGAPGQNGQDGKDGQDGVDGKDGADGITPQLKIEGEYWYISYDNGVTWTRLGKATGEDGKDGQNGQDGKDGKDGDSFFKSVDTSNEDYVIFTLSDGTQIQLPTWYAFEQLRRMCNEMNTNISALQVLVDAVQNRDYITSCTPYMEDGVQLGYTINFAKGNPIVIYYGKDGADGEDGKDGQDGKDGIDGYTPVIGVRQDSDGIYYWTLDGDWLLDADGNKIKAQGIDGKDGQDGEKGEPGEPGAPGQNGQDGKDGQDGQDGVDGKDGEDGITPQLKIEGEYWYISYDNGESWSQLGKATGEDGKDGQNGQDGKDGKDGDSFFKSVTQDEQNVYFELADGTVITLPKGTALNITFDEADLVVMSTKSTRSIGYTVSSMTDKVTVEVTSSADIKAKVIPANNSGMAGSIQVITGDSIDEYSKVIVFVSNGDKVIMRSITFEEAGLVVEENVTKQAPAKGGEVVLEFLTNVKCEASIPEEAQEWISVVPATRALTRQAITLKLEPNEGYNRSATVTVQSPDGRLCVEYQVEQNGDLGVDIDPTKIPDNEIWYVTNDNCIFDFSTYPDFTDANIVSHTYDKMGVIKFDKTITVIKRAAFSTLTGYEDGFLVRRNNRLKSVFLPNTIEEIHADAFASNSLLNFHIPKNLKTLGIGVFHDNHNISFIGDHATDDGKCIVINDTLFVGTNIQGDYVVPQGVQKIADLAFATYCNSELNNILLPDGLKYIGYGAFMHCPNIKGEIFIPQSVEFIGDNIFSDTQGITRFYGNDKFTSSDGLFLINNNWIIAYAKAANVKDIIIPEGVVCIGNYAFSECNSINSVQIPSSLVGIMPEAFSKCKNLEYVYGKHVSNDNKCVVINKTLFLFAGKGVVNYTTPKDVEIVNWGAFSNLDEIESVILSDNVQSVNATFVIETPDAFITYYNSMGYIFQYSRNLKTCSISANMKYLGYDPWGIERNENLNTIYMRAIIPPIIYHNLPDEIPSLFPNLTIYVPEQSLEVYMASNDWAPYKDYIKAYNYTDLPNPDYYTSTDYSQDGVVTTLQTATKGNGIDIVLMGDAYSDRQIADGTYRTDMEYIYNNLFTEEPYKSFKDYFNVHYVTAVSATEGYEYGNTAFGGYFGDGTSVGGSDKAVFDYALKAISEDEMDEALLIVAMNSDNYAGTCYMYYPDNNAGYGNGVSVSYFPRGGDATTFAQLLHHEACGHGFAKLADEYAYDYMGTIPDSDVNAYKTQQADWGWWKNVDFTNDLSQIRWSRFLNDSRYQYDGLGAYEGGLTYWSGVWRPTENSIMRYNTGGFNAPSREAIYYRIHKLAYGDSWQYDYEEFVEWDARNRKAEADMSRAPYRAPANFKHTAPPVVVNKSWRDAK